MKGKFVKGLSEKLGTGPPEMHPLSSPAGFFHWGDSAVALHLVSIVEALTAGPEGHNQTGDQGRSSTRQGVE
jgi:hypothetical protein